MWTINIISPLRQLPSKAIREEYALGIVTLFPFLKDPYAKKGYVIFVLRFEWHRSVCMLLTFKFWDFLRVEYEDKLIIVLLQEHFYYATCGTGYISWRLKNVLRKIRHRSLAPPDISADTSPGGPNLQRTVNVERQLDGDTCQEAMSLLSRTKDNSVVFQKMRETFQYYRKLVHYPGRGVDVLSTFWRFLDTKGLVSKELDILIVSKFVITLV